MNELAARGLDSLLERAFEVNHVPEAERASRRTLIALARLSESANDPSLTSAQRQKLVSDVVAGIGAALPKIDDPNLLMRQAFVLITQGVERDVNTLEYWGENTRTQAQLRPTVQTVMQVLQRCQDLARAQADDLANKITAPSSPYVARYEAAEKLAATAEYTRNMAAYDLALAMDSSSDQRKKVAGDAIDYLRQFNVPENPDRTIVRNRIAKLAMLRGNLDTARKTFASVLSDTGEPKPTIPQQYEARYFLAVTELLAKLPDAAEAKLRELVAWQDSNLPNDPAARKGAQAAAQMLRYRIASLRAELAKDATEKKKQNDAAVAILMDLLSSRPDLRAIIYDQLLPRLDEKLALKDVEPLLLRALVSRGEQEIQRTDNGTPDEKALNRAIEAAREIIRRRGNAGVDDSMVNAAELLIPFFLQRLGKLPESANAFVESAEQLKASDPKNASLALDNAQALIGKLRADPSTRESADVTRAYERFLPLAIAEPFNRREFAFEYARRLQLDNEPAKAAQYYELVPRDDKRAGDARFLRLVALKQQLDSSGTKPDDRSAILKDLQSLADVVREDAKRAMSSPGLTADEPRAAQAQSMLARTSLLAADVARREQHDPTRALALLDGFEASVGGLPTAQKLIDEAMYLRVQSYMAAEQYDAATATLVKLLNRSPGGAGAQIVYNLLEKLNADFDAAQQSGDRAAMRSLAKNRAQLSGFLVKWAAENSDPNIRKFTYRYKVFDAETQRRAAQLEEDQSRRNQLLQVALERYRALGAPENLALYKASLSDPAEAGDPNLYDPQVVLGIGLTDFDLGDYQAAAIELGRLISQRKLGPAVLTVERDGQEVQEDNDTYWEALLKLVRSNQKLNQHLDDARSFLKQQYITWGSHVGGQRWKSQYEALRKELIPDFDVNATTQQAAGG